MPHGSAARSACSSSRREASRSRAPQGKPGPSGSALIFHGGGGTSLLSRNTDLGGMLMLGGSLRVHPRLALTLEAQEYLFSSQFASSYSSALETGDVQPAGSRFRKEFTLLAGLAWRVH